MIREQARRACDGSTHPVMISGSHSRTNRDQASSRSASSVNDRICAPGMEEHVFSTKMFLMMCVFEPCGGHTKDENSYSDGSTGTDLECDQVGDLNDRVMLSLREHACAQESHTLHHGRQG